MRVCVVRACVRVCVNERRKNEAKVDILFLSLELVPPLLKKSPPLVVCLILLKKAFSCVWGCFVFDFFFFLNPAFLCFLLKHVCAFRKYLSYVV